MHAPLSHNTYVTVRDDKQTQHSSISATVTPSVWSAKNINCCCCIAAKAIITMTSCQSAAEPAEYGLSSILRPRQHSIGYMGAGYYRSKDPANSIKVLKQQIVHRQMKHTISRHKHKTQQVP